MPWVLIKNRLGGVWSRHYNTTDLGQLHPELYLLEHSHLSVVSGQQFVDKLQSILQHANPFNILCGQVTKCLINLILLLLFYYYFFLFSLFLRQGF